LGIRTQGLEERTKEGKRTKERRIKNQLGRLPNLCRQVVVRCFVTFFSTARPGRKNVPRPSVRPCGWIIYMFPMSAAICSVAAAESGSFMNGTLLRSASNIRGTSFFGVRHEWFQEGMVSSSIGRRFNFERTSSWGFCGARTYALSIIYRLD
jgi:hypothetical protein